jgi:uncharacterized caspase-like protein
MTDRAQAAPVYHVLLIGVDAYPAGFNSLSGCVNDIDAIEGVLFDPPGIGIAPERIRLTRLDAPRAGVVTTSRFAAQTRLPTHDAIRDALLALAGPDVQPGDRVLIYYSGHGDQKQIVGSRVWHEALVPCDVQYLYDFEVNALLHAISARTSDLTAILDSCHSGGATREDVDPATLEAEGTPRFLASGNTPGTPPDPTLAHLTPAGENTASLVQSLDPPYLALVACQSNEKAREKPFDSGRHGVLTYNLVQALNNRTTGRDTLRWADLWTDLLDRVTRASPTQHPWLIGRAERRVFGGPWDRQDPGYAVRRAQDGSYQIAAGRLMGLTEGAQVAVYGPTPSEFPTLNSPADLAARLGVLRVTAAARSDCTAQPGAAALDLPGDARGRLIAPGSNARLRALLDPPEADVQTFLEQSPLLQVVPPGTPDAEVAVRGSNAQGWIISNDVEARVAGVVHGARGGLRAGLESYARYNMALRLAQTANDPQLTGCLTLRLLDCNDPAGLAAADPSDPVTLPEAPRDADRIYAVPDGFRTCLVAGNTFGSPLFVTVLDATATGLVQILGDVTLQPGDHQAIWKGAQQRVPFNMRPGAGRAGSVERLLVIGTTRPGVSLAGLRVDHTVQEVVDVNSRLRGEPRIPSSAGSGPVELWTALTVPVRVGRVTG